MGFFIMLFSAIIGLALIIYGFLCIKSHKIRSIASIIIGVALVIIAIWLGMPK